MHLTVLIYIQLTLSLCVDLMHMSEQNETSLFFPLKIKYFFKGA